MTCLLQDLLGIEAIDLASLMAWIDDLRSEKDR